MSNFISLLASPLDRFLRHKRARGFAYRRYEHWLHKVDRVAVRLNIQAPVVDEQLIRRFIADVPPGSRSHGLTVVRQLARFLAIEDPRTFVPPRGFLGIRRQRPVIRVLSREESGRFLTACQVLTNSCPHRGGLVHGTALHAMALTGMRRGEIIRLKVADVDVGACVISIRGSKFGKSRFVPISDDLAETLWLYDQEMRSSIVGRGPEDAFFPGRDRHSATSAANLYNYFREALRIASIPFDGRGKGPGPHSLRHSFAVLRLLGWYEEGADLSAKLPQLATYLGHLGLESLRVYLHLTRDIAGEVNRRCESHFGQIIAAEAL